MFCALALVLAVRPGQAQGADPHVAQPERPSVATHAFTVAPGWLELEFGAARESEDGTLLDTNLPVTAKLGLAPTVQLSLSVAPMRLAGTRAYRTDAVGIAVKWRVWEERPVIGSLALLPTTQVPTAGGTADPSGSVGLIVIASRSVRDVGLDLNVGHSRRVGGPSDDWTSQTMWAASGGGPLVGRVSWGAELFGSASAFTTGPRVHLAGALASATISARPWLAFDLSGTIAVSGAVPRTLQIGAVWNAGRLWGTRRRVAPELRGVGRAQRAAAGL